MARNYIVWWWGLCYYRAYVTFKTDWLDWLLEQVSTLQSWVQLNAWQLILKQTCHATSFWSWCACWLNRLCLGGTLDSDLLSKQVRIVTCPRGTVLLIHLLLNKCTRYLSEKNLLFKHCSLNGYLVYLEEVSNG